MNQEITEKNLVPIKKNITTAVENSNALQITDVKGIEKASDILNGIATISKSIKAEKNRIVGPAKEIIAWAKEKFGPLEKECEEAETIIKKKMIDFDKIEEERKKKEIEEISEKALSGEIDIDKIPEKTKELEPVSSYSGNKGSVQFKKLNKVHIIDLSKIPLKYLIPNEKLIKEDILEGIEVPGAEIVIEKIVARGRS